jgi:transcriptional regulator with XRE-family HTH domain
MADAPRRAELAAFLRSRREAIDPAAAGFTSSSRRRTPGLRREEVALLSGVSVTWYTWLEQQRKITVSRQVIESLARALALSPVEQDHLFMLAGLALAPTAATRPAVSDALRLLLDTLEPNPACVTAPFFELLAWNQSYAQLIGGLDGVRPAELNTVWLLFTEPWRRATLEEWDREAVSLIGQVRASLAKYPDDDTGPVLVEKLCAASEQFRDLWNQHSVRAFQPSTVHVHRQAAGPVHLQTMKFTLAHDERQGLTVFLAADADTTQSLARLWP